MKNKSFMKITIIYFVLLAGMFYMVMLGENLYLQELQQQKWITLHTVLTFAFTLPVFFLFQLNLKDEDIKEVQPHQLFLSLLSLILILVTTTNLYEFQFHSLVPFDLRMISIGVEIVLVYFVIYVNIGFILFVKLKLAEYVESKRRTKA